jgi:PAS domain S-box-containing protein
MEHARILIAEDEQILQHFIRENVEALGYEVVGAVDSGEKAIDQALKLSPEVVLMDIRLKGDIDGIEAAEAINRGKSIPIVYLTAYADDKTLDRAKLTTPYAYLLKPFNRAELKSAIEIALYRKKMESKVYQSEKKFRSIFEDSLDAIYISTPAGQLIDINPAGCKLFGYTKEELFNINISQLYINPEDRQVLLNVIKTYGSVKEFEVLLKTKQGTPIIALITASHLLDSQGVVTGYQGIIRDFTEKKQLEEKLIQTEKMDSIGRMAGGMAHDFNNLLTIIFGYAEKLSRQIQDKKAKKDINIILKAGEKAARLIESILIFCRKKKIDPRPIDLNKSLAELEKMLGRVLVEHLELQLDLMGGSGWIYIDKSQLEQVIINLALNARDAMPRGGRITISTHKRHLGDDIARKYHFSRGGDYIELVISDTGIGMDKATQEKIFEPFFTTKKDSKGTGLGLSTVYGIVKQNDGVILVDSIVGEGTTFTLLFPEYKGKIELITQPAGIIKTHWKDRNVLIVEDAEDVLDLASAIYDYLGFQVISAKNGEEALRKLETFDGTIDLLFTDILLPGMPVSEIVNKVTTMYPDVKVVYTSGYPGHHLSRIGVDQQRIHFIQKPYLSGNIMTKLEEIFP